MAKQTKKTKQDKGLTFHASNCTKNCGGHRAGWYWARKNNITTTSGCNGKSNSFNQGCKINVEQKAVGINLIGPAIRGANGKFTKFDPKAGKQ